MFIKLVGSKSTRVIETNDYVVRKDGDLSTIIVNFSTTEDNETKKPLEFLISKNPCNYSRVFIMNNEGKTIDSITGT